MARIYFVTIYFLVYPDQKEELMEPRSSCPSSDFKQFPINRVGNGNAELHFHELVISTAAAMRETLGTFGDPLGLQFPLAESLLCNLSIRPTFSTRVA